MWVADELLALGHIHGRHVQWSQHLGRSAGEPMGEMLLLLLLLLQLLLQSLLVSQCRDACNDDGCKRVMAVAAGAGDNGGCKVATVAASDTTCDVSSLMVL